MTQYIPLEICHEVFSYVQTKELIYLQCVCREWNETILSDSSSLWYDHLVNEFQTFHFPTQQSYRDSCIILCQQLYKDNVQWLQTRPDDVTPHLIRMHFKGDTSVGKTSICNYAKRGEFTQEHVKTQAFALRKLPVQLNEELYDITIFDHEGESVNQRSSLFSGGLYTGRTGVVLVFDLMNPESLDHMRKWYDAAKKEAMSGITQKAMKPPKCILVGNKYDHVTKSRRLVQKAIRDRLFANELHVLKRNEEEFEEQDRKNTETLRDACNFAMERNIPFMCVSVLEGTNVKLPILHLLNELLLEPSESVVSK
jgi:GTPase SAR1 family protein